MESIFKQIIDGKLPSEKVFENDRFIAIKDKFPVAPVHLLIIPKKEIKGLQELEEKDFSLLGEAVTIAKKLARDFHILDGYSFVTNNGPKAGQSIFHLHFHLIGGRDILTTG